MVVGIIDVRLYAKEVLSLSENARCRKEVCDQRPGGKLRRLCAQMLWF